MRQYLSVLLAMTVVPVAAQAQAPAGEVYVATYVEVVPTATGEGATLLKQYRDATRKDAGNLRAEVVQETNRPSRFAVLTIWTDQKAFEAHGQAAHTAQLREKLKSVQAAPSDERVNAGMSIGTKDAARPGAVFVVTHVDVPPPQKDTLIPLLVQLSEASRKETGNVRFEVQQQGSRPNHFTVLEIWSDPRAYDAHVAATHTRQFRDKLGPMTGALYDERLYKSVD